LPLARPAAEGFSEARLKALHDFMADATAPGRYAGAVTLIARNGKIVDWRAVGHRDAGRTSPMKRDTIFRIYSMTKPVNAVAVLMLVEEGGIASLDDAVGRYLPEFTDRKLTIRHLLTHMSGLARADGAVEKSADLKAYAEAASRLPPLAPPGTRFDYNSVNTEVASRIVEAASGMPFDAFLARRIFGPLRMHDTGFTVPARKRARIADMTSTDADGNLVPWPAGDSKRPGDMMRPYFSGAGGLYSTAGDFARFSQMLLDGGRLDGVKILGRGSVEMMMTNQLTDLTPPVSQYREGFGLGGFVNLDDPARERPGAVGAYGWSGAAGTYFMIDPRERLVAMLLTQHIPQGLPRDPQKISFRFYNLVYQSLAK
jgi:CubicO group peptidase (beta-lactamase class C family)